MEPEIDKALHEAEMNRLDIERRNKPVVIAPHPEELGGEHLVAAGGVYRNRHDRKTSRA